jgi:hypothetical protein
MKSYYYLDYLHREIFLEEEDIQTVPESGRADDACSAIAEKPYVVEQFMADSFRTLKDVASRLCDSPDIKSRHDALMYIVWRVALDIKEWRTLSHSEAAVKVTREDGFVWLLVSAENARKLWEADVFSLYRLYADDSESLIESEAELESTIKGGYQIGIEVGFASVMDHAARVEACRSRNHRAGTTAVGGDHGREIAFVVFHVTFPLLLGHRLQILVQFLFVRGDV